MTDFTKPSRRLFLSAIPALIASPAIVRSSSLMPVKVFGPGVFVPTTPLIYPQDELRHQWITIENLVTGHKKYWWMPKVDYGWVSRQLSKDEIAFGGAGVSIDIGADARALYIAPTSARPVR